MAYYCEISSCTNKAQVRGLCRRHYNDVREVERAADYRMATREPVRVEQPKVALHEDRYSAPIAYALWLVLGIFGAHRFYLRDFKRAVGLLLTAGGLGIWWLIDVFFVGGAVRKANSRRRPLG